MLKLFRYNSTPVLTQGLFFVGDEYCGDSLELPWRSNLHDVSCIPEGKYDLEFGIMHDGLSGYKLLKVEGREGIWIHPASTVSQLKGCIATGIKYGEVLYHNTEILKLIYSKIGKFSELVITKAGT